MPSILKTQFERTTCKCPDCRLLCENMPGLLAPGDIEEIAKSVGIRVEAIQRDYLLASTGAIVSERMADDTIELRQIPLIVPKKDSDGCVFLRDGQCRIHFYAPFGCGFFDSHMSADEGKRRVRAVLSEINQSVEYKTVWQWLWDTRRRTVSPDHNRCVMVQPQEAF